MRKSAVFASLTCSSFEYSSIASRRRRLHRAIVRARSCEPDRSLKTDDRIDQHHESRGADSLTVAVTQAPDDRSASRRSRPDGRRPRNPSSPTRCGSMRHSPARLRTRCSACCASCSGATRPILHVPFARRAVLQHERGHAVGIELLARRHDLPSDDRHAAIAAAGQDDHRSALWIRALRQIGRQRRSRDVRVETARVFWDRAAAPRPARRWHSEFRRRRAVAPAARTRRARAATVPQLAHSAWRYDASQCLVSAHREMRRLPRAAANSAGRRLRKSHATLWW